MKKKFYTVKREFECRISLYAKPFWQSDFVALLELRYQPIIQQRILVSYTTG